jgi:hypothetical protein
VSTAKSLEVESDVEIGGFLRRDDGALPGDWVLLAENLEFFTGFEAYGFSWRDGDFGSGAWVTTNACLAGFDGEDAKPAELDAVAAREGFLHGVKDSVDGRFGFDARKPGTLYNSLDEVLLNQDVAFLYRAAWSGSGRSIVVSLLPDLTKDET